jgi:HrpA-like RNA helicase
VSYSIKGTYFEIKLAFRVVLMSATVEAEKISAFFGGCPMLHVPGRTFPVDIRYLEDAVELTQWSFSESSQYARRRKQGFYFLRVPLRMILNRK